MLVLSRKANETIVLDNAIEVTVLEILGERVKIGINAPRDVPIVRQELLHQPETIIHHRRSRPRRRPTPARPRPMPRHARSSSIDARQPIADPTPRSGGRRAAFL